MNKAMKKDLETVVNAIVNEDTATGTEAFHNYIRAKSQTILLGEKADEDEDEDEDESSEDESDEDDSDDSDEDDKKPAFLKKGKKSKKDEDDE